jgi:chemotaxis protein MotB
MKQPEKVAEDVAADAKAPEEHKADVKAQSGVDAAKGTGRPDVAAGMDQAAATMPAMAEINSEARAIKSAIDRTLAPESDGALPGIEVKATREGVLVSLTDKANFGMFAIGSAEPKAKVVIIMQQIAAILNATRGSVVIRGHTDARPYRSGTYDNWRLSTARAHMAQYMLVRAGFDEGRIERVEGHADRMLKVPGDPEAAENRRIEILLRADPQ